VGVALGPGQGEGGYYIVYRINYFKQIINSIYR
jgi:hypothetical protein